VKRWIANYNDSGSLDDAKRAGRPRKVSKSVERTVERKMRGKRRRSSRVIARELNETEGLRCELHDRTENSASSRFTRFSHNRKPRDCLKLTSAADCSSPRPTSRGTGATWCLVTNIRSDNSKEATHDTTVVWAKSVSEVSWARDGAVGSGGEYVGRIQFSGKD